MTRCLVPAKHFEFGGEMPRFRVCEASRIGLSAEKRSENYLLGLWGPVWPFTHRTWGRVDKGSTQKPQLSVQPEWPDLSGRSTLEDK